MKALTCAATWLMLLAGLPVTANVPSYDDWDHPKKKNESCCFRDYQGTVHCLPCHTYELLLACDEK